MRERNRSYDHPSEPSGLERGAEQAIAYLRSRNADHWLMFVAGVIIGMFLG